MLALLAIALIGGTNAGLDSVRVPAYRVCGIDRTGSYDFVAVGREACAQVIARANPGDLVAVRWISGTSYATTEQIVLLRLPATVAHPCASVYDTRCKGVARADALRIVAAKQRALQILRAAKPDKANASDFWGFFAAAADLMLGAPKGARKMVYVTGDFDENVRHTIRPAMSGVEVYGVAQQTSESPERTQRIRARWTSDLRALGATVSFRADMSEVP
jgi:hypothetical protein